jgi:hypothetical protein
VVRFARSPQCTYNSIQWVEINFVRAHFYFHTPNRDVTTGKFLMQPLQWWGRIYPPPPGWNRVKVSENLGATAVAPVTPAVTSLAEG